MASLLAATLAVVARDAQHQPAAAVVSATIAKVQAGALAKVAGATVAPTLPAASAAGTLLVATVVSGKHAAFSGTAGWTKAAGVGRSNAEAEVWYYGNNPGGITTASFTVTGATFTAGQLSEWSGVATSAPVDKTATDTATAATTVSPSTSAATTVAGDLAVTAATENLTLAGTATFTPGAGWTNFANTGSTSSANHYTADYRTGVPVGTVAETITSSALGTNWAAALATFKPLTCQSGTLTIGSPASTAFSGTTLTGLDGTATTTVAVTPSDLTGSAAGWNVQATSTTFTNGASRTLPVTATTVTGATSTAGSGTCNLPTNTVTYPVTLPAAATAPTAVKVFNAAAATGGGAMTVTLSFQLAVPASAYSGSYTSTWTFTVASGP